MPLLRRAAALVLTVEGGALIGHNFLRRSRAALGPRALQLLVQLGVWRAPAELFPETDRATVGAELVRLLDAGLVLVDGTAAAEEDARLAAAWPWGAMAGLYHFGVKDPDYIGPAEAAAYLDAKAALFPQVPLTSRHVPTHELGTPDLGSELLALMARRRSWRGFDPDRPLPLAALRDCLFAGAGIVGFAPSGIPGEGQLPLRATPSGGARNPFEAYVVARAVDGLPPGVYHYAGVTGTLARLGDAPPPPLSSLLGGQRPFDAAGALVLLVAVFERSAWKYPHPTGYRVILIEAGHIAQNVLLAATQHGLAACPTCAVSDAAAEALLGLDRVRHAVVHTVALGVRGAASPADVGPVTPNPAYFDR